MECHFCSAPFSHVFYCKAESEQSKERGRRRNASPRDLPAVAAAEEVALPKTSLIFPITGMEALRTSDHGSCGNLPSLEEIEK